MHLEGQLTQHVHGGVNLDATVGDTLHVEAARQAKVTAEVTQVTGRVERMDH